MKRIPVLAVVTLVVLPCLPQETVSGLTPDWVFTLDTADEFTEYPGGFDDEAAGSVLVGGIPSGGDGFTDGQGAMIVTAPGELELLMFPTLEVGDNVVLIRASVQSTGGGAAVALAVLDGSMDGSIATNIPADSAIFRNKYHRMVLVYDPPGTTIVPVFQVANQPGEQALSVYLDNLEVFLLPRDVSISSNLLYGESVAATWTPTPSPMPTPIPSPIPTRTPLPTILIDIPGLPSGPKPLQMVLIPAGTFMMGSSVQDNEGPEHDVTIMQPFYLGKYEVTQAQWTLIMGENEAHERFGIGDNYPAYYVSWNESQAFIEKLNGMRLGAFRLPTEAEWEYACRAGTTGPYYWEGGARFIADYAWYAGNTRLSGTKEVAGKLRNNWGLYDMSGNVLEWCEDDWHESYEGAPIDGSAWVDLPRSSSRVFRGGCWSLGETGCRSAARSYDSAVPGRMHGLIGFRLVREYP